MENSFIKDEWSTIYHITPAVNLNKINKKGLVPKANCKFQNHPERIYLLNRFTNNEQILSLVIDLYNGNDNEHQYKNEYLLLGVNSDFDIERTYNGSFTTIDFNRDNNMENSIFTYDNIPANKISALYKFKIELSNEIPIITEISKIS